MALKEGDLIKFGHVNGAAIKPGDYAPQQVSESEFVFRVSRFLIDNSLSFLYHLSERSTINLVRASDFRVQLLRLH
jgi:hypothetical protein